MFEKDPSPRRPLQYLLCGLLYAGCVLFLFLTRAVLLAPYSGKTRLVVFAFFIVLSAVPFAMYLLPFRVKEKKNVPARIVFTLLCLLGAMLMCRLCANVISVSSIRMGRMLKPKFWLPTFGVVVIVFSLCWLILPDCRLAGPAVYLLCCVAGYAYDCVFELRGFPFTASDLQNLSTAAAFVGEYQLPWDNRVVLAVLGLLCLIAAALKLPRKKPKEKACRIGKPVFLAASLLWAGVLFLTPFTRWMGYESSNWADHILGFGSTQGIAASTIAQFRENVTAMSNTYSDEDAPAIRDALNAAARQDAAPETLPSLIVIVNESLTDFGDVGLTAISSDPLPRLHAMQAAGKLAWGRLFVSSYGGNTCNTEHTLLTSAIITPGTLTHLFGTMKENTPSLAWYLRSLGYSAVYMHPQSAANYNRSDIIPKFGFDRLMFQEDFAHFEDTFHIYPSDEGCYKDLIALYEQQEGPQFLYLLTMQNHSTSAPFPDKTGEPHVTASFEDAEKLSRYLECYRESDRAFEELVEYFSGREEPVAILMLGDHHPKAEIPPELYTSEGLNPAETALRDYITPYILWANYPMETGDLGDLSVNYLAPLLLEKAGVPLDSYYSWLLEAAKEIPVINYIGYGAADGSFTEFTTGKVPEGLLSRLDWMRYNRLYGGEKRLAELAGGMR